MKDATANAWHKNRERQPVRLPGDFFAERKRSSCNDLQMEKFTNNGVQRRKSNISRKLPAELNMPGLDVLVFGDYFCDFILTGMRELPRLGADLFGDQLEICPGGAFIITNALHRLGVKAAWAADFGSDMLSRFVLDEAAKEGLDASLFQIYDQPLRRMSLSFSFAHDRGFISHFDPLESSFPLHHFEQHRPAWTINLPFESPQCTEIVHKVREAGTKIYFDCQYVDYTFKDSGVIESLQLADVFAPNESEALQLTQAATPEAALERLAQYTPLVVIKLGKRGAIARQGSQTWSSPALDVEVVDTTGAGDCFNAGFLAAMIQGLSIDQCLRWGNICGSLSTTRRGGVAGVPTLEQLLTYL
jgi:sugar/nucleoside kinase (ribokinase family)